MRLISIPANPVPDNVVTGMLKTPDGVSLRFARFAPPAGRRGTVCVFPGRTEWIEKYFETVRDLRNRGFAVALLDWRGQGLSDRALSDRLKGYVGTFSQFDIDLETFMREVVLPDCPPPIFALGHSMGATILIRAVQRGHRWFDRIVLSGPMISIAAVNSMAIAGTILKAARFAGFGDAYVPGRYKGVLDLRPFAGNILTSDPVRYARNAAVLEADPELGLGGPTVTWCDAAFRAMRQFHDPAYPARIRQPILIVAAGRDAIVSNTAIEEFAMLLRAGSHLVVTGAQHEILMEQDRYRSQLWAAFDAFIPGTPLY
ncbi:MAG: alpha/beta fold hydrolase [Xanthobacteraceae bacterium]